MVTSLQRLGTILMFFGSAIFVAYLTELSTVPQIVTFKVVLSVSTLIVGSILSYGFREFDDRFLKALGMNAYLIGTGYELKSILNYDSSRTSCACCILGGLFMIVGLILVYVMRGKPTIATIRGQFIVGCLIFAIGGATIGMDILLRTWTHFRVTLETIRMALIGIFIGMFYFLNGLLLNYIAVKKTEGRVEPDVIFFGENNIFGLIFY